jgi:copper chaperone
LDTVFLKEVVALAAEKTFAVHGMDCSGCENRLKTVLGRTEGVIKASADHKTGQVSVRFDEQRVDEHDVRERIRAAGYEVA